MWRGSTTSRSRRPAAVGQRALAGNGAAGAHARGARLGRQAEVFPRPARARRVRARRAVGRARGRRRTARTTASTRSRRACGWSTGSSTRSSASTTSPPDRRPGARRCSTRATRRARDMPRYDTGAWSLYARGTDHARVRPQLPRAPARLPDPVLRPHADRPTATRRPASPYLEQPPAWRCARRGCGRRSQGSASSCRRSPAWA